MSLLSKALVCKMSWFSTV